MSLSIEILYSLGGLLLIASFIMLIVSIVFTVTKHKKKFLLWIITGSVFMIGLIIATIGGVMETQHEKENAKVSVAVDKPTEEKETKPSVKEPEVKQDVELTENEKNTKYNEWHLTFSDNLSNTFFDMSDLMMTASGDVDYMLSKDFYQDMVEWSDRLMKDVDYARSYPRNEVPKEFLESFDLIQEGMVHYEKVARDYPQAIQNMQNNDTELLNEVTNETNLGNEKIKQATEALTRPSL